MFCFSASEETEGLGSRKRRAMTMFVGNVNGLLKICSFLDTIYRIYIWNSSCGKKTFKEKKYRGDIFFSHMPTDYLSIFR